MTTDQAVGYFTIDAATRTLRGTLLPYDVMSRGVSSSQTKPIKFPRGNLRIPRDPIVVSLNDEHKRHNVIGRATALQDREEGVWAEFTLADDDAADAWLADHLDEPVYLSAEVADMTRAPGDIGAGRLAGAAVTAAPAFDGTLALFSMIGDEEVAPEVVPAEPAEEPDEESDEDDDDDEETTDPAPAETDDEPVEEPDEAEEDAVADAIAPTAQFSRTAKPKAPALTKAGFFSALAHAKQTRDMEALKPYMAAMTGENDSGLFALSNVKYDGTGGLAADAGIPNQWLGELFDGERSRSIVPLLTPGVLQGIAIDAWTWTTKPGMAAWAGNKAAVPSNAPAVTKKQFFAQRFAGGHDLAREFYDFGQTDMIASYFEAMADSYAGLSDGKAYTELVAGATAFTPGTAGTVGKSLSGIVDGALAVVAAGAVPTFAIVAPNIYRDILLTPANTAAEYLTITAGLSESSAEGFKVVPWAGAAAGQVIVGAKRAATAWELPGSPIRVSAPDLVLGGVDSALFGYIAVGVTYPAAVVKSVVTLP